MPSSQYLTSEAEQPLLPQKQDSSNQEAGEKEIPPTQKTPPLGVSSGGASLPPEPEKVRKFPTLSQWLRVFGVLTKKEKTIFLIFFILFLGSGLFLSTNFYCQNTEIQPAFGGKFTEGVVGGPRFINPVLVASNDTDRDLVELIFSGLMKYTPEGEIVPDLVDNFEIKEDGKVYEIYLKQKLLWHDGQSLTAEDVIFTIKTIQNPDYKSPLRANFIGVEMEKIEGNELGLRFKLKNSYSAFLEKLTVKIVPKHVWQDISPENFPLAIFNLKPVGSGPYTLKGLNQDKSGKIISLDLKKFKNYFGKSPYLSEITFQFFENLEDLKAAAQRNEINSLSFSAPAKNELEKNGFQKYSLSWPSYFAVFLNPAKSKILADKEIRQALNYVTDKTEIVEKVFLNQAEVVDSPILPQVFGFNLPTKIYEFNQEKATELFQKMGFEKKEGKLIKTVQEKIVEFKGELKLGSQGEEVRALQTCLSRDSEIYPEGKVTGYFGQQTEAAVIKFQEKYAKEILEPWGFKKGTGIVSKTTRKKLNEICQGPPKSIPLQFTLKTVEDPILKEVAEILKEQWANLGVEISIETYPLSDLEREVIKPRDYEGLLLGEILGAIPDPYPFWHSSQKRDPGLNLADFESSNADKLLAEARTALDPVKRAQQYEKFQDILIEEAPGIFLYSPNYIYWISNKIKGAKPEMIVDPSKRFAGIEEWHYKTKRVWK